MPIKKSELYSSLWQSADQLRGSMDASQYKDFVLSLLFIKYISDKKDTLLEIPKGSRFEDFVKLKGQPDIGDQINKRITALAEANRLSGIINKADFDRDELLGKGKEKVDKISNLISIFQNDALDFSGNKAADDDILGDAFEYLMRHFATQSGKSKGQFYTPAEVSRIMAKLLGVEKVTNSSTTVYDMTCGSGSLLLKVADEAPVRLSLYGQENDENTRALAIMNMFLHNNPAAEIALGNTLSSPEFLDSQEERRLKRFDYAVANPPFSYKSWTNGLNPEEDEFHRFDGYGVPPSKNGDYAFLLHMIQSLKSDGKAAIILPLGVLFRGNAEETIRKQILKRGYIKGIIGLPPNLFYGTGIAASILVIDKEHAADRDSVFFIDASKGFVKDGKKNRLRERDIHKIVDTFRGEIEIPKYSRKVPMAEIADEKNDYNLNIPRYIDTQETEDIQDIQAHLSGGVPERDIDELQEYWAVYPSLREDLFYKNADGFYQLHDTETPVKEQIFDHPEFVAYGNEMNEVFTTWKKEQKSTLYDLAKGVAPKKLIADLGEDLLAAYDDKQLVNKYAMYQLLRNYWTETMQDDVYEIAALGWEAGNKLERLMKKAKKKNAVDKPIKGLDGLRGLILPTELMIKEFFGELHQQLQQAQQQIDDAEAVIAELEEEHLGEDGLLIETLSDAGNVTKGNLKKRIKAIGKRTEENADEYDVLHNYKKQNTRIYKAKKKIKTIEAELETKLIKKYPEIPIEQMKELVIEKKWVASLKAQFDSEFEAISYRLAERLKELVERYQTPLSEISNEVSELQQTVESHLKELDYQL